MPQLQTPFDATKIDPAAASQQLPVSDGNGHLVVITESSVEPTKDKSGGMVVLTLSIIEGPMQGQSGPYRLNLYNQSAQACEIAQRQLSGICHAVGVFQVTATEQLHNKPFRAVVGYQKGQEPGIEGSKGYTEVKLVKAATAASTQASHSQPFNQQQDAPKDAPAWGNAQQAGQPSQSQPPANSGWQPQANGTASGVTPPWGAR